MIISGKLLDLRNIVRAWIGRMMMAYYAAGQNGNFYINGADVLPAPLSAEEEAAAVNPDTEN